MKRPSPFQNKKDGIAMNSFGSLLKKLIQHF